MKRFSALFLLVFAFFFQACEQKTAEHVEQNKLAWSNDLTSAQEEAKNQNKLLLLEFSTEWCTYCRHIEQRMMPQPDVAAKLQEMVLVHLDGDLAANSPLMEQYQIKGFPTFLIFSPAGEELVRFSGVNSKEEFVQYLAKAHAADPKAKNQIEEEQDFIFQIEDSQDDAKKIELAHKALKLYPQSVYLPYFYASIAKNFHSSALSKSYWMKAVDLIKERLNSLEQQSDAVVQVTLDEHVDLLAEADQELLRFDEVQQLYAEAGRAAEKLIERHGGMKQNEYLIGTTVYFYLQSGDHKRALNFLREALKELPSYWPVHSGFAKVYAAKKDFTKARESYGKAYELAEEVAKTRVGLAWADVCALQGDFPAAFEVLSMTQKDIEKLGHTETGRAKVMLEKITKQRKEYELAQSLGV